MAAFAGSRSCNDSQLIAWMNPGAALLSVNLLDFESDSE
jgi:hypothetical protein